MRGWIHEAPVGGTVSRATVLGAAFAAFGVVAFPFGSELIFWRSLGLQFEIDEIALATAGIAIAAALATALAARLGHPRISVFVVALPAAGLPLSRLVDELGRDGRIGDALCWIAAAGVAWVLARATASPRAGFAAGAAGVLTLLLCAAVSDTRSLAGASAKGSHPDVVFLVMDTVRPDHLSLYGYPKATTPNLDRLAKDAAVYRNAWSVSPWTPASHASMFTALLPAEHGVDGETLPRFPMGVKTVASVLHGAGYRTAGFAANPNLFAPGWEQGFDVYRPPWIRGKHSLVDPLNRYLTGSKNGWLLKGVEGGTQRVFNLAREWWNAAGSHPRFLFLNLIDAHRPYDPPEIFFHRFMPNASERDALRVEQDPVRYHLHPGIGEPEAAMLRALYDGELAAMDEQIGEFFSWLDRRGDLGNTLVVIVADHGERLGERGLVGHDLLMDSFLLRVPLVVRFPGRVRAGPVEDTVQLDGLPGHILELAGVPAPEPMASRKVKMERCETVVAQYQNPGWFIDRLRKQDPTLDASRYAGDWFFAARGRYALVWSPQRDADGRFLADLAADPGWARNVADVHADIVNELIAAGASLPRFIPTAQHPVDADILDRLRSLGYVN